jgi:Fe/S biogenesis protein NfuA
VTDPTPDPTVRIEERALAALLEVRDREPDAAELGLVVAIAGVRGSSFAYELGYMRLDDARPEDHVVPGELPLIIPAGDVEHLRGATLTMSRNLLEPGLVIDNPNTPSPRILGGQADVELTGPVAERVTQTVTEVINPAIASHGGYAEVVAVEDGTVYLRLGGGCQGCGMATVTLSQGIEATLRSMVPEVTKVVDVTDHAGGENPYYEQAKK